MVTVVHCRRSSYDTYIGRANGDLPQSKWANPWVIGKDGTRDEVIAKYEEWIKTRPELMGALPELKDKVLGCWCKPEHRCHGDVLARLIDGETSIPPLTSDTKPTIVGGLPETDIIPLFSTDKSLGGASVLTLEEAGKAHPDEPTSICDIAKTHGLKQVVIVDDKLDAYMEAVKNIQKTGLAQLVFGLKTVCCADHEDKTDASFRTESKIIIFIKNRQGYYDLLKIHNLAATTDFYHRHRTSWRRLKDLWTSNLALAIPFFSGFTAVNQLKFSSAVPEFPIPAREVTMFREVDSDLPFAPIIDAAIDQFAADTGAQIQKVKSIYYATSERFRSYMILRAIDSGGTFSKPQVDHLSSDRFSWARYCQLTKGEA
jgi:hypothetical protein